MLNNGKPLMVPTILPPKLAVSASGRTYYRANYLCSVCGVVNISRAVYVVENAYREYNKLPVCRSCAFMAYNKRKVQSNKSDFLTRAYEVHADRYEYFMDTYINRSSSMLIRCTWCNKMFTQVVNRHLQGNGCPQCANNARSWNRHRYAYTPTLLYLIYFPSIDLYKIGITNRTVEQRYKYEPLHYDIIYTRLFSTGEIAWNIERHLLHVYYVEYKYKGPKLLVDGNSELLSVDPTDSIDIFINEILSTLCVYPEVPECLKSSCNSG